MTAQLSSEQAANIIAAQAEAFEHDADRRVTGIVEALRMAEAALRAQEWKPIETAPKDWQEILTCNMLQGGVKQLVSWNALHNFWQSKGEPVFFQDTHWMPLPPNPHPQGEPK